MVALSVLGPGEYPPDDEDFVLVSIARNGKVQVTARFGATGFRSTTIFEKDAEAAAEQGLKLGRTWAKELRLGLIYVEREETPNA